MVNWTDEHLSYLKAAWGKKSCTVIADDMSRLFRESFSRNAIIGKAHRIGLASQQREDHTQKYAPIRKPRNLPPHMRPTLPKIAPSSPPIVPVIVQGSSGSGVTLLEAGYGQCRAVLESSRSSAATLFCGEPVLENTSYCPIHAQKYYRTLQK